MSAISITKNNFQQEVLSSGQPVLVDFWAPWCGPCRMFAPIIEQVADEKKGAVKVGKINIDEEPDLAQQFGVMSIPTLVLFRNGKAVLSSVGLKSKPQIEAMLR